MNSKVTANKARLYPLMFRMEKLLLMSDIPEGHEEELEFILKDFEKIKASGMIFGVGINDIPGDTFSASREFCRWYSLLERCYGGDEQTYLDCYVCEEWLVYSNFKKWLQSNPGWENKHLDKDLLVNDNKEYSPSSCCLISPILNINIKGKHIERDLPWGVNKRLKKNYLTYRSAINDIELDKMVYKESVNPMVCHKFWQEKKIKNLTYLQSQESDSRVIDAVEKIIQKIQQDIEMEVETTDFYWT